ncbi:MAG TPA: hypothetical protein VF190_09360, partial [Rhodothermales bacterium]
MSKYDEMVNALFRARERGNVTVKLVGHWHELLVKAIVRELGTKRDRVSTTALEAKPQFYLPRPAENTVFKNKLSIRLEDESGDEPGVTFTFEVTYGVLVLLNVDEEPRGMTVWVNGRDAGFVSDEQTAR